MQKSRLLKTLRLLEEEDLNKFDQFLSTPYHNTNETLVHFFRYIRPHIGDQATAALQKKVVFPKFFTIPQHNLKRKDTYQRLRTLMSRLLGMLETFLALDHFLADPISQKRALIKKYIYLNHSQGFTNSSNEMLAYLESHKAQNPDYYLELCAIFKQRFTHPELLGETQFLSKLPILQDAFKNLQHYYHWFALWQNVEAANTRNIHSSTSGQRDLEELLPALLTIEPVLASPKHNLYIYFQLNKVLEQPKTEETYNSLWTVYQENIQHLSKIDQRIIFSKLLNYCAVLKPSEPTPFKNVFECYRFAIEHNILIVDGRIYFPYFIMVIISACNHDKIAWATEFIASYQSKISPIKAQDSCLNLAKGFVFFYQKEFVDAKFHLSQQLDIPHIAFDLVARSLLLRTSYEVWQTSQPFDFSDENSKDLKYECAKLKKHLLRVKKKVSPNMIESYFTLIEFVRALIQLKRKAAQKGVHSKVFLGRKMKLLQKVKEQPFFGTSWVLKKIDQTE